jgi:pimeloyl-ACP methyl ester carboxylesterase
MDLEGSLSRIACPTLIVTTKESGLQSVAAVEAYARRIPDSRLIVLPGDSYHIAAAEPAVCVAHLVEFLRYISGETV